MNGWLEPVVTLVVGLVVLVIGRRAHVMTARRYRFLARELGLRYRQRPVGVEDLGFLWFLANTGFRFDHELSDLDRPGAPRVFEVRRSVPMSPPMARARFTCVVIFIEMDAPHTVIESRGAAYDFDGRWGVTCDDLAFAEALLDDRLTRWLMSLSSRVQRIELFRDHALLVTEFLLESGGPEMLDLALDFVDHLPAIAP